MATDPPPRLVTVILLTLVAHVTLATAIPKLLPSSGDTGSDAAREVEETEQDTGGQDQQQQPMMLSTEATDGEEPVFIEFSYAGEKKNEGERTDDPRRYSYNIIDSPKANARKLIPVVRGNDAEEPTAVKDAEQNQNPNEEQREQGVDSILQWNARRQIELEENVPGSHNWPKHVPDYLRPISPFPDDEGVVSKGQGSAPGKQMRRNEAFVPSEKFPPPPRSGPYLYPQSILDREFRVPFH